MIFPNQRLRMRNSLIIRRLILGVLWKICLYKSYWRNVLLVCWQLICGCRAFNNYKNSNYKKKLRRSRQKFEFFFVKFPAPFSQKIINIHLYISYKAFIRSIDWLWWSPNNIYYNNQSPHWKTILFVETTKLFISNSVRVYRYICEIF